MTHHGQRGGQKVYSHSQAFPVRPCNSILISEYVSFFFRICQFFFCKTLSQIEVLYPWILLAPRECTTESFAGLCSSIYEFIRCCSMSHRGSSKNRSEAVPVVPPNHRRTFGICNPLLIHSAVVAEVAVCAGPVYGTYHPGCTNVLCAKTLKSTKAQKTQGKSAPK